MPMKNSNAYDFAHKQIFKTRTRDNFGGGPFSAINQVEVPVHLHTFHIPKATTGLEKRKDPFAVFWSRYLDK